MIFSENHYTLFRIMLYPDKVTAEPCLWHESVCFSSTLGGDVNAPRRCGRIAGCRAFNLPQGTRARLFARAFARKRDGDHAKMHHHRASACCLDSVEPAFVAEPHHLINENLLLLVVETCKKRVGGVGDVALILRAI